MSDDFRMRMKMDADTRRAEEALARLSSQLTKISKQAERANAATKALVRSTGILGEGPVFEPGVATPHGLREAARRSPTVGKSGLGNAVRQIVMSGQSVAALMFPTPTAASIFYKTFGVSSSNLMGTNTKAFDQLQLMNAAVRSGKALSSPDAKTYNKARSTFQSMGVEGMNFRGFEALYRREANRLNKKFNELEDSDLQIDRDIKRENKNLKRAKREKTKTAHINEIARLQAQKQANRAERAAIQQDMRDIGLSKGSAKQLSQMGTLAQRIAAGEEASTTGSGTFLSRAGAAIQNAGNTPFGHVLGRAAKGAASGAMAPSSVIGNVVSGGISGALDMIPFVGAGLGAMSSAVTQGAFSTGSYWRDYQNQMASVYPAMGKPGRQGSLEANKEMYKLSRNDYVTLPDAATMAATFMQASGQRAMGIIFPNLQAVTSFARGMGVSTQTAAQYAGQMALYSNGPLQGIVNNVAGGSALSGVNPSMFMQEISSMLPQAGAAGNVNIASLVGLVGGLNLMGKQSGLTFLQGSRGEQVASQFQTATTSPTTPGNEAFQLEAIRQAYSQTHGGKSLGLFSSLALQQEGPAQWGGQSGMTGAYINDLWKSLKPMGAAGKMYMAQALGMTDPEFKAFYAKYGNNMGAATAADIKKASMSSTNEETALQQFNNSLDGAAKHVQAFDSQIIASIGHTVTDLQNFAISAGTYSSIFKGLIQATKTLRNYFNDISGGSGGSSYKPPTGDVRGAPSTYYQSQAPSAQQAQAMYDQNPASVGGTMYSGSQYKGFEALTGLTQPLPSNESSHITPGEALAFTKKYGNMLNNVTKGTGIPPSLLEALAMQEGSLNPNVRGGMWQTQTSGRLSATASATQAVAVLRDKIAMLQSGGVIGKYWQSNPNAIAAIIGAYNGDAGSTMQLKGLGNNPNPYAWEQIQNSGYVGSVIDNWRTIQSTGQGYLLQLNIQLPVPGSQLKLT